MTRVIGRGRYANDVYPARSAAQPIFVPIGGVSTFNPKWYAKTDIYWDPVKGDDEASGDAGQPVKTMAEICKRYGTAILSPRIPDGQAVVIHQLNDQALSTDCYAVNPVLLNGAQLAIIADNPQRGVDFSPASMTAAVKDASGVRLSLNGNLPAGIAPGDIVLNVTKKSRAIISKVSSGNATIVQPVTDSSISPMVPFIYPVADNTWTVTDTYRVLRPLISNMQLVSSFGGFTNAAITSGMVWCQGLYVPDASGGSSGFTVIPFDGNVYFLSCTFEPFINFNINFGDAGSLISCLTKSATFLEGWGAFLASETLDTLWMQGVNNFPDVGSFCHNIRIQDVNNFIYEAGCDGNVVVEAGAFCALWPNAGIPALWGPCTVDAVSRGTIWNRSGTTFANILKVNSLLLDGVGTGTKYAAGVWTDGIALTVANLDASTGLQNPRTGSRYSSI